MNELNDFEKTIFEFLIDFPASSNFLLAVSGGADSMAMLAAVNKLLKRGYFANENISCIHVDHGIRSVPECVADSLHVASFCEENKINCKVTHIKPGKIAAYAKRHSCGIEAAARFFRHRALRKQATLQTTAQIGKNTFILLAHTLDDLVELAIMRILRGTGPAGLAAMPKKRGRIIRPMLDFKRAEILMYLIEEKISWREDSTNEDIKFLRNRIRHAIIPKLDVAYPSWRTGIFNMAQTQSLAADFIAMEAKSRVVWSAGNGELSINNEKFFLTTDEDLFFSQALIIREESVFQAINLLFSLRKERKERLNNFANSVKRSVVRQFCQGAAKAANLGSVTIKRDKGVITLAKNRLEFFEAGIIRLLT